MGLDAAPVVTADGGRGTAGGGVFVARGTEVYIACIWGGMADGGAAEGGRGVWNRAALVAIGTVGAGVGVGGAGVADGTG